MTICAINAGNMEAIACGRRTRYIVKRCDRPIALAASVCPLGIDRMPERRISAITEPLYKVNAKTTAEKASCRSEEHTSELQSRFDLVCRLLLEKKKKKNKMTSTVRAATASH